MGSPTCPLCYGLDLASIRRVTANTCAYNDVARHWMSADELRASSDGAGGTDHTGRFHRFKRPCSFCALLKDAVDTFFRDSGVVAQSHPTRLDSDILDYSVAIRDADDDGGEEDGENRSYSSPSTSPSTSPSSASWEDVDDDDEIDESNEYDDSEYVEKDGNEEYDRCEAGNGIHSDFLPLPSSLREEVDASNEVTAECGVPKRLEIVVRCKLDNINTEEFDLEIFTVLGAEVPPLLSVIGAAGEVPTNPEPYEYAAIIKNWLQECLSRHTTCQASANAEKPMPLPKRVLDLSDDKVVLIETGFEKDLYVSLSHCWGREQILVTTRETLAERMRGIDLDKMPRTFQDAVILTRALGLRYLWIDSLCIIQQDEKDWAEQSAVMADIYAGCYINIATTRSSRGGEGFISPRWTSRNSLQWADDVGSSVSEVGEGVDSSMIRRFDVKSFTVSRTGNPDLYDRSIKVRLAMNSSHESMHTFRWINSHKDTAPLIQRGWGYQERNLSPRTVHFHANEMMWDCAGQQCCECLALNTMKIGGDGWSASKSRISTLSTLDERQLHGLWRTVVEDYCLLNLTYESDRLPALGGLATRFAQHMSEGEEYLAGLWRSSLPRDLLWTVSSQSKRPWRRQLGEESPPSWSWASLVHGENGPGLDWEHETKPKLVSWQETVSYEESPHFSVVKASCSLIDTTQYGRISGGSITVTGTMCAIALSNKGTACTTTWASRLPIIYQGSLNSLHLHYDDQRDADEIVNAESPSDRFIFCLFIGTFFQHFDGDTENKHPEHRGLILKPSSKVSGAAERIGSWKQYIEDWVRGKTVFTKKAVKVTVTIV